MEVKKYIFYYKLIELFMFIWYTFTLFAILVFGPQNYESTKALCWKEVPPSMGMILFFPAKVIVCSIGREIYVLTGLTLTLLFYFVAPLANIVNEKEIFPEGVRPSLVSYLLIFLIFSSGFWLRTTILLAFLATFHSLGLMNYSRGARYPDRLKEHHAHMRLCFKVALPLCIIFVIVYINIVRSAIKYIECCFLHDLLVLVLVILYFIVSSLEIKRKRDPWPFP
jgi:hypothetical protein